MKLSISEDEFPERLSHGEENLDILSAVGGKRCDVFLVEDELPRGPATLAVAALSAAPNV
ncbi:hypothetical protein OS035_00940 [Rhizobium sp. 268]|uniref:hypothetical protein n=1 Tax=Rhizobium sp. 268 TaxID=2996375 RepID=UPI002F932B07